MRSYIIAADDAKAVAKKLRTSLQTAVKDIHTISPDGFLKSKTIQNEKSVKVILLTTLTWQDIQRQTRDDVKRLFSTSMNTIVLTSCSESVKSAAVEMFSKTVDDWASVNIYEASGEEWYKADAKIRYRLSELEDEDFHIPGASKYIIKPDSVSTLSESPSEVLIILFHDGTAEHSIDVKKVEIKAGENLIEAKKIQSNVWSFSAIDLNPGDHEIRVFVDSVDIGTNILHVQDQQSMLKSELANLKREDPERFLSELLQVDKEDFDHDLVDTVSGSSCIALIETLLKYGDENECEYPNFLHFCAKYGYATCVNWCQRNLPNFKEACMVQNKHGKTPEEVAVEAHQNKLLIRTLQVNDSDDEDLQLIGSPFKPERFIFGSARRNQSCPEMAMQSSRDSGWSSQGGSGDSLDPPYAKPNIPSGIDKSNSTRKRFEFIRKERTYNTIEDEEDTAPYNRPWDTKTILANRSAQAVSAGTLSRSVQEDEKGKRKGLFRSNTTAGHSTNL